MSLTKADIKRVRDAFFKSTVYKNAVEDVQKVTPAIIRKFTDALLMHCGGGLTSQCTLDAILIVVGYCLGRANVKIHDNYR